MKKMTLEKTWKECLRMWWWVARQPGEVEFLKKRWLEKNGYGSFLDDSYPENGCFFCEYDSKRKDDCINCPGYKVDKLFDCRDMDYHWYKKPKAFYNKLCSLNRRRLASRNNAPRGA